MALSGSGNNENSVNPVNSENPPGPTVCGLEWFELQVAPCIYRFAIVPDQPILMGLGPDEQDNGATMLIRHDRTPALYQQVVDKVSSCVEVCGIMDCALHNPQLAFADEMLDKESVHMRIAYTDGRRWASVFAVDHVPMEIGFLLEETKKLTQQVLEEQDHEMISGTDASTHVKSPQQL